MLHEELRTGKDILCGFVENEAERTDIATMTAALTGIQKLHVTVLEETELQSLCSIVHFGRNYGIGEFDVIGKLLIDVEQ